MKKVIVTGANGFIGSYLVRELVSNGIEVIAVVRNDRSNTKLLSDIGKIRIIYCELSEISTLADKITDRDIDVFYHFAWEGSAGSARVDAELQMKNVLWTAEAVRIAKELGCHRFVGAGSIMEDETIAAVTTQENRPGLPYIYGTGKFTAHCISKSIAASIDMDHIWGVITNAYGPGELSPRFINTTIRKIINNERLQFTAATQNYDFVYITDVAKAFYFMGLLGKPFSRYLIGSSHAKPLKEFIIEMQQILAPKIDLQFGDIPFTGINLPLEVFSTENITKDTGYRPSVPFSEGIKITMDWLKGMEGLQ